MKALALVVVLASAACTPSLTASNTAIALDIASTYHASDGGRWDTASESNALLGPQPQLATLALYGFDLILINTALNKALPSWLRTPLAIGVTCLETQYAYHNELHAMGWSHQPAWQP